MRRCVLVLVLLLLATTAAVRAEEEVSEGPWTGILPDPEPTLDAEHFACRVVDDATGTPIAGARFVRTPEWIAPGRVRHDAPLGVATTDALGVAWLPATPGRWEHDCHWLALAEGYGFAHAYGKLPPVAMRLRPEAPLRGRVVDPLGRPIPGAVVEVLGGCSHGTAGARAVADAGGTFVVRGVDDTLNGQLWVAGPGIASDLLALRAQETLGTRGIVLAMESGRRYVGRIVDLLGAPVEGAVVRATNEHRGPATATRADGTFVLDGVEEEGFVIFPPADMTEDTSTWFVGDAVPGIPCRVVVSPLGVLDEEPVQRLLVRARGPDGRAVGGVSFWILHARTGRGPAGWTAEDAEDGGMPGEAVEEVGPGPWRVVAADSFAPYTFEAVDVPADDEQVELDLAAQPRLRIVGEVPEGADLELAVPGASASLLDADELPWLPVGGEASLRVAIEGCPPFFFEVGPAIEGVRTARVVLPPPCRLVLPAGARDAWLADGERDAYHRVDEAAGVVLTDARGPLTLTYTDADGRDRALDVVVPDESGAVLVLEGDAARVVPEPVEEEDGEPTGPCRLELHVEDLDGPVDAVVLVGDALHRAPTGLLAVEGLEAGRIRVVVARRDVVGPGRVIQVDLVAGETVVVAVELPLE